MQYWLVSEVHLQVLNGMAEIITIYHYTLFSMIYGVHPCYFKWCVFKFRCCGKCSWAVLFPKFSLILLSTFCMNPASNSTKKDCLTLPRTVQRLPYPTSNSTKKDCLTLPRTVQRKIALPYLEQYKERLPYPASNSTKKDCLTLPWTVQRKIALPCLEQYKERLPYPASNSTKKDCLTLPRTVQRKIALPCLSVQVSRWVLSPTTAARPSSWFCRQHEACVAPSFR